ncbi:hypothetical protein Tcan_16057 [Toxocara canis]|uniref:ShKT domain-containing protein n=1 Tax=Toxocara canis TaxID=6265 RepID=A0A0B2VKH2_TOXCA|nr:hypothetical protein Tcan_16057 [Toxocara canis]
MFVWLISREPELCAAYRRDFVIFILLKTQRGSVPLDEIMRVRAVCEARWINKPTPCALYSSLLPALLATFWVGEHCYEINTESCLALQQSSGCDSDFARQICPITCGGCKEPHDDVGHPLVTIPHPPPDVVVEAETTEKPPKKKKEKKPREPSALDLSIQQSCTIEDVALKTCKKALKKCKKDVGDRKQEGYSEKLRKCVESEVSNAQKKSEQK